MKVLVTGGAGFIGSHIVEALAARGDSVVVYDDLSAGTQENLSTVADSIAFVQGDIRDERLLAQAMTGCEVVLHLAAVGSVPRSVAEPALYNDVNITGTFNVLAAAREVGVRRLIFSSSSSVYGPIEASRQVETLTPFPASPYALSKLTGEHYARLFHELYGLETLSLRYFNVFGPRQDPASEYAAVVPKFLTALQTGKTPIIYGDGEQSRDFTYVANVVAANLAAAMAPAGALGQAYNIAAGRTTSVNELLQQLQSLLATSITPEYNPARPGEIRHSHADVSLAQLNLDYNPKVTFEQGLEQTVSWFRQTQQAPV